MASSAPAISADLAQRREALLDWLRNRGRVAVAFSGGVDSAVVAQAARLALGDRALAVTGTSASLAEGEAETARRVAAQIGIRHVFISTTEFDNPLYQRNAADRCYHCKDELYSRIGAMRGELGFDVLVNGANADDAGDYRPGMVAAGEHAVSSPLLELGFTKSDVRALAADWGLEVADKPASPCLSSRVAYGEAVSPERLAMIDRAEQYLRALGCGELRVRYHQGDLARIEVTPAQLARLASPELREPLVARLRELGFRFVTLDLAGFRSGSLNTLLPVESLRPLLPRP
jgi:pyridinium-3,5-biscarboxylic acid mononucleotide sulfurtransferase